MEGVLCTQQFSLHSTGAHELVLIDMTADKKFYNYPTPREGPNISYYNPDKSNPIVRGLPLLIVASAYATITAFSY